jgi:hypothetical protein
MGAPSVGPENFQRFDEGKCYMDVRYIGVSLYHIKALDQITEFRLQMQKTTITLG